MLTRDNMSAMRREYGNSTLSEDNAHECPLVQFESWFSEILKSERHDPTAMVLSTVDEQGNPDSRVVLLKEVYQGAFVFYTNYESTKAAQIINNAHVALNFFWPEMVRQVRVRGIVSQTTQEQSQHYFTLRPFASQVCAVVSPQSKVIPNRDMLEEQFNAQLSKLQNQTIDCPPYWGGYAVTPHEIEFWQGRDNRLHDRLHYQLTNGQWQRNRLAP